MNEIIEQHYAGLSGLVKLLLELKMWGKIQHCFYLVVFCARLQQMWYTKRFPKRFAWIIPIVTFSIVSANSEKMESSTSQNLFSF